VTFTVNPRVRRIAAHAPDELPPGEFYRQMFWSSGVDLPDNLQARIEDVTLDLIELPAGEKAFLSLQLPPGVVIIFDPVTHATQFIEAKGEPTHERQNLSMVIGRGLAPNEMLTLRPGSLRLSIENHTDRRVLRSLKAPTGTATTPGQPSMNVCDCRAAIRAELVSRLVAAVSHTLPRLGSASEHN